MFEDSLIESGGKLKDKRLATTTFSFILEIALIGVLVLIPLLFTEALPKAQLMMSLTAPPPPPPPPPPPTVVHVVKQVQTNIINDQLRTPTKIPKKIEIIKEDAAPPPMTAGVIGGIFEWSRSGWRRDWRNHQFDSGRSSESCRPHAGTGLPGRHPGSSDKKSCSQLSTPGASSSHPRECAVASRNQQRRVDRKPAGDQRASYAGAVCDRRGKAVEVQAVHFEWRTRGSRYSSHGEFHPRWLGI